MPELEASQKIGLQAYLGTDAFDKAMNAYMGAIDKMNAKNTTAAQGMSQKMSGAANTASGALTGLIAKGVALGNILSTVVLSAVNKVVAGLKNLISGSIDAAARVQELSYVAQIMARNAGISYDEIEKQVAGIKDLGIRTDEAYNAVIKFMQSELDMSKATQLARVAQDAAVIAATDSSDAYARLIYATTTYNTETLRTMGFNLRSENVFREYAATLGKTSEQLTQTERSQAFLNAVIEEGGKIAGAYEAAMEAPGKQMRSWKRDVFELTRVLGEPFLNAYASFAKTLRDVTQAFRKAFDEGGPFRNLMINLGAAASLVTEAMGKAARAVSSFVISLGTTAGWQNTLSTLSDTFGVNFDQLISDASSWGKGFIESFANGIIDGIASVLNALAYVGEVLTSWLSSKSPPKLLPDLDKWGAAAMDSYLKGFTQADFSIFKDISNIMESLIKSKTGEKDTSLIDKILGGREALAAAIAQVNAIGQVTEEMVNRVAEAVGESSEEFKAYTRAMLQSEIVSKRLADAQADLVRITSRYDDILKSLNDQLQEAEEGTAEQDRLAEIEQAMATGLLTESEYATLANEKRQILLRQQIRATEEARDKDVSAAQDKVDAAQAEMDTINAQIELQRSAIEVQIEQNNLIKEQIRLMEEAADKSKGGAAKDLKDALKDALSGAGAGGALNIKDKVKDAINAAKETLKVKLGELWGEFKKKFKPIENAWKNLKKNWAPIIASTWEDIKRQLGNVSQLFSDIFTGKWEKVPGDIWKLIRTGLETLWKWIKIWVASVDWKVVGDEIAKILGAIWEWLKPKLIDLGKILLAALLLLLISLGILLGDWLREFIKGLWDTLKSGIKTGFETLWDNVKGAWETFKTQFSQAWTDLKDSIIGPEGIIPTFWKQFKQSVTDAWNEHVVGAWGEFKKQFSQAWTDLKESIIGEPDGIIPTFWSQFKQSITDAWGRVTEAWGEFKKQFSEAWTDLKDAIVGEDGIVANLWKDFKTSIENAWENVKGAWETFKTNLTTWWNSMDWGELGRNVVNAIINSIASGAGDIWNAILNAIGIGGGKTMSPEEWLKLYGTPGEAAGGLVKRRGLYELAEQGPELVIPADLTKALFGALKSSYRPDLGMRNYNSGNSYNNSRTVNLEINPTYEQVQSPAGIHYDVTAALIAARV